MKNSGVLSKVRDTENVARKITCQKKKKKKKKISFVVLPVKKRKKRVGERKPLSLKLLSTVSRSSVSSYY